MSIGRTVERPVTTDDIISAELRGFGRRWNYGSLSLRGQWSDAGSVVRGVVISLGLEASDHEVCNGALISVTDVELERLDQRESDYQRTDVSDHIRAASTTDLDGPVVTYVPRPSAVERYLVARDASRAAVRRTYWDLVHGAFGDLGVSALERFVSSTPGPDVPIADVELLSPERRRSG